MRHAGGAAGSASATLGRGATAGLDGGVVAACAEVFEHVAGFARVHRLEPTVREQEFAEISTPRDLAALREVRWVVRAGTARTPEQWMNE